MRHVSGPRQLRLLPFAASALSLGLRVLCGLSAVLPLPSWSDSLVSPEILSRRPIEGPDGRRFAECLAQAASMGSGGKGPNNPACARTALRASSPFARRMSEDGQLLAFASDHMLFVRRSLSEAGSDYSQLLLSGSSTGLKQVVAIALDSRRSEAAIIDASSPSSIQIYPVSKGGSFAYRRRLKHPSLEGIRDLALDGGRERIYAVNPNRPELLVLDSQADDRHPSESRRNPMVARIAGDQTGLIRPASVAVDSQNGRVFVLDTGRRCILVFGVSQSGNVAPTAVIESGPVPIGSEDHPSPIGYDRKSGTIQVLGYDSGPEPVQLRFRLEPVVSQR
jgi:hypothetical protein